MGNDILLGKEVFGNWIVKELIGTGSFGSVYKIERDEFGHIYTAAMKLISIPADDSELEEIRSTIKNEEEIQAYFKNLVNDLINEITLMDKLKGNSNIVSYEDHLVVEKENKLGFDIYIRMELLTPLNSYIEQHEFTVADVVILGINICRALEICHNNKIIHRDIKPQNIYASKFGDFKIGDFGIAKQLEKDLLVQSKKGTFAYMAPEVYLGKAYYESVDTYSLGLVLYRLLNDNRTPFLPYHPVAINYEDKESSLVSRMSGMPLPSPRIAIEPIVKIILKACAFKVEDRYEFAVQMRSDLEKIDLNSYKNFKISGNGTDINEASSSQLFGGNSSFAIQSAVPINKDVQDENNIWGRREPVKPKTEDYSELFDSTIKETNSQNEELKKTTENTDESLKTKPKNNNILRNVLIGILGVFALLVIFIIYAVLSPDSKSTTDKTSTQQQNEKNDTTTSKPTSSSTTQKNGIQKVTYSNGVYEGNFVNGNREGKGVYTFSSGARYEGEWLNGLKSGSGKMTYSDGTYSDGIWKDDKRNGYCETKYTNGNFYQGKYIDDLREDTNGKLTYASGTIYTGTFLKDKMTGNGKKEYKDGVYTGTFVDANREGTGIFRWTTGDFYDGEWKGDKQNGNATYYSASSNKSLKEVWQDGKRIK